MDASPKHNVILIDSRCIFDCRFHVYRERGKCGNTAPKTVKISKFGHKFVPQGRLVCNILRNSSAIFKEIFVRIGFVFVRIAFVLLHKSEKN